jgi:hypothetical protein
VVSPSGIEHYALVTLILPCRSLARVRMAHKNERVELEMQILKYRDLVSRIMDEEFQKRAKAKIAELELKLREIDE